jgi:hypothetical protein
MGDALPTGKNRELFSNPSITATVVISVLADLSLIIQIHVRFSLSLMLFLNSEFSLIQKEYKNTMFRSCSFIFTDSHTM